MGLWDKIRGWKTQPGMHLVSGRIPKERVAGRGANDDAALSANKTYFRIWLVEMFLAKSREWFVDRHAAVNGLVKLEYADQKGFECARVAAPSKKEYESGQAVLRNYLLLPLVPFNGGTVEVEAVLLGMKGTDYVARGIEVLSDFAGLVGTPLSTAMDVAAKVKGGADKLLGDGDVRLPYHDQFAGAGDNALRAGYIAAVLAPEGAKLSLDRLSVDDGRLRHDGQPIVDHDYMLLRVEAVTERDDWEHFSEIATLRDQAIEAFADGDDAKGEALVKAAVVKINRHPDLALYDRRRLGKKFADDMKEWSTQGAGAATDEAPSWTDFIARLPAPKVDDTSEPSIAEALSAWRGR